jgi:hypothetical protein
LALNLDALAVILPYRRCQEIHRRRRFARHRCDTLGSWCLVASNIAGR